MSPEQPAGAATPEFLRFALLVIGSGALICLLGYLPTRSLIGEEALGAMVGAVVASVLGSIIGGFPIYLARLKGEAKPQVVMISMIVRLVAVVLLAAFTALALSLPTGPFLIWLALAYLLLLVVDTRYAMVALGGS